LAIVSLIALFAALALAALVSLQPWSANSVAPQLSVAPGLGADVGDAVALAPGRQLAVADARPAAAGKPRLVAAKTTHGEASPGPALAIAPARAVATPPSRRPPEGSPAPPSSEPLPPSQPAPAAVPVAVPAPAASPDSVVAPKGGQDGYPPAPSAAGADPNSCLAGVTQVREGDQRALSFFFYARPTAYRLPGEENLIVRFSGEANEMPSFALQLWDDGSGDQRGLWASGEAIDGERFLAPVVDGMWHELVLYFQASSEEDGFYLAFLDGEPIDVGAGISLIDAESGCAQVEVGLFRSGAPVTGASDVFFASTQVGESLESVIP
jgi:hypothetical protein